MSENKRFYWLKLKEDFFEDDTIGFIEEQENGKEYALFYLKLCLKALKTEGKLIRVVGEILVPYDAKKLAEITNTDFDTVSVAMSLFFKIGLIKKLESGEIFLSQLSEMTGSETDRAQKMREKRAYEKVVGNNVTRMLPECYQSIEKEKDKELELEINILPEKSAMTQTYSDFFENLWIAYNRKGSKKKAYAKFQKLSKDNLENAVVIINQLPQVRNREYLPDLERLLTNTDKFESLTIEINSRKTAIKCEPTHGQGYCNKTQQAQSKRPSNLNVSKTFYTPESHKRRIENDEW